MFLVPIEGYNPTRHAHYVLRAVIGLNVAAFAGSWLWILFTRDTGLFSQFGFVPAHPSSLTLLTSMFLHGGLLHLLGNMFFLWIFGDNVEDVLGGPLFLGCYLLCGLAAVFAYYPFHAHSTVPLVGASGAISGVIGMYLVFFPKVRAELCIYLFRFELARFPVTIFAAVLAWLAEQVVLALLTEMTALGKLVPVAFSAHVGGFLAGCALGWGLRLLGLVRRYLEEPLPAEAADAQDPAIASDSPDDEEMGWKEGFALIVGVTTLLMASLAYRDYPAIFGEHALVKLTVIGAIGGAICFVLHVERGERLLALAPGLLAGAGAVALASAYEPGLLPGSQSWNWLVFAVLGAAPGFLLMWALRRLAGRGKASVARPAARRKRPQSQRTAR